MPTIQRVSQGKIFHDEFNTTALDPSRWIVSPSDVTRYSMTDVADSLRLKHGDCSIYVLTDVPPTDFLFEMRNDYRPVTSTDTGGIVLYNTITNRVEFVEIYDPVIDATYNYQYMRVVRKGNKFEGYGSQDRVQWEYIGAVTIDEPQKMGWVLNGKYNALAKYLDIQYGSLMQSRYLYVSNVMSGHTVKLKKQDGTLLQQQTIEDGKSVAAFDMFNTSWPFDGFIEVYSTSNTLITKSSVYNMWPGDVFEYSVAVTARFQRVKFEQQWDQNSSTFKTVIRVIMNKDLTLEDVTLIGNVDTNMIEGAVYIKNEESVAINNLEVFISDFDGMFGNQWVKLAPDDFGQPGVYSTSVMISTIPPGQEGKVWMKVTRDLNATQIPMDEFRFRLLLKNI